MAYYAVGSSARLDVVQVKKRLGGDWTVANVPDAMFGSSAQTPSQTSWTPCACGSLLAAPTLAMRTTRRRSSSKPTITTRRSLGATCTYLYDDEYYHSYDEECYYGDGDYEYDDEVPGDMEETADKCDEA